MSARLTDSDQYSHLWGTRELRSIFDEPARLQCWLDILTSLAEVQAQLGYIPTSSAKAIRARARVEHLDLAAVARETRRTGHSTLGLIHELQAALPAEAREHVYYGATVQDLTDTWTAVIMRRVGAIVWRDLRTLEGHLLDLAEAHRDTAMIGRTHGQAGAAITFGWKAASWADEVRRHLDRLRDGADRWLVGQLGGAVGTAGFFGSQALQLRRRFCAQLDLADPGISWLSARDRVAEFGMILALIAGTLGRLGNEVYALARTEVDEVREPLAQGGVSSITMPHKRNAERSEHLVTLARLTQAHAQVLLQATVHEHERDGRSWKAEWVAVPELCLLTGTALALAVDVFGDLDVRREQMRANLERYGDALASERLLAALTAEIGKHSAQAILQDALRKAADGDVTVAQALTGAEAVRTHLSPEQLRAALAAAPDTGSAGDMVDVVVERAHAARERESNQWP